MHRNASALGQSRWLRQVDRWSDPLLILGLFLAALVLFCVHLGDLPLRDWDEGTVAQVAREILRAEPGSWTWLYPTLHGEPYFNKPPLMHGLIAAVSALSRASDVTEWTARLPGAILTATSVPLLFVIGREVFGGRSPAVMAALVYLTLIPVVRHGRLAMLDGAVLCFFMVMMVCLLRSRRNPVWALGVGLGLGLIGLTKGILAILLGAIALGFLAWDAPRLLACGYLWGGIALGSLPAVAWYGAQWLHYGHEFLAVHTVDQSWSRVWQSVEGNRGPLWYYGVELLKYGFPWILFLPQGMQMAWQTRLMSWAKLVLVWGIGYLLPISLMGTKLPWYVLPVYPAIALAVAVPLSQTWQSTSWLSNGERPPQYYPRLWSIGMGVLAIAAWIGTLYLTYLVTQPELDLQRTLVAVALTMTSVAVLLAQSDRQFLSVLLWGMYVSLVLFVSSDHWIWELAEDYPVRPVAAMVQANTPPGQVIYSSHPITRPSLDFYSDRQVVGGQTDERLLRRWRQDDPVYLLVNSEVIHRLTLPQAELLDREGEWVLIRRDIPD